MEPTNRIDLDDPRANMFGVLPCPRCGSERRWPTRPDHPKHPNAILCDECGLAEPVEGTDRQTESRPSRVAGPSPTLRLRVVTLSQGGVSVPIEGLVYSCDWPGCDARSVPLSPAAVPRDYRWAVMWPQHPGVLGFRCLCPAHRHRTWVELTEALAQAVDCDGDGAADPPRNDRAAVGAFGRDLLEGRG